MSAVAPVPRLRVRRCARAVASPRVSSRKRPWTFWVLAGLFAAYVLALYGPMLCIYVLSFQDIRGGLVFPMKGLSLHWFVDLFTQVRTGDVKGGFERSIVLAILVTVLTVVGSFLAGLAFRQRFKGDGIVFYLMIGSLVAPGLVLGIGIGLLFQYFGLEASWYTSALGAHLSWTLPFGVLVMFAVMSRFDRAWEEAARDLGATRWQIDLDGGRADPGPRAGGGRAVRLHALVRRILALAADLGLAQHAAARDLEHDLECHFAVALCAGHGDDASHRS